MVGGIDLLSIGRNMMIYLAGVGLSVAGALGMANAIQLWFGASALLFVAGLVIVVAVHQFFDGPF